MGKVTIDVEDIFDGFNDVELPRYDLNPDATVTQHLRLRCGYAITLPIKAGGETASGIVAVKQDGIPTGLALILAISPFHVPPKGDPHINDALPKVGDLVMKNPYAGQPLNAPCIGTEPFDGLAPMERSARGLQLLAIRDIKAILPDETA